MSVGEIAGLAATILLVGLLMGLWIGFSIRPGYREGRPSHRDRIDAYARWLAARRSLSRASTSLVAAFRSLAAEPQAAANHALRREEAQRARAFWCETMRELDRAEAALVVHDFLFDDDRQDSAQTRTLLRGRRPLPNGRGTDRRRRPLPNDRGADRGRRPRPDGHGTDWDHGMAQDRLAWADVDRVDAAALQVAINGTKSEVEQLIHSLEMTDKRARDVVREAVTRLDRRRVGIVSRWARDLLSWISVVVDRWSEP